MGRAAPPWQTPGAGLTNWPALRPHALAAFTSLPSAHGHYQLTVISAPCRLKWASQIRVNAEWTSGLRAGRPAGVTGRRVLLGTPCKSPEACSCLGRKVTAADPTLGAHATSGHLQVNGQTGCENVCRKMIIWRPSMKRLLQSNYYNTTWHKYFGEKKKPVLDDGLDYMWLAARFKCVIFRVRGKRWNVIPSQSSLQGGVIKRNACVFDASQKQIPQQTITPSLPDTIFSWEYL